VKTNVRTWLTAIKRNRTSSALLGLAAVAVIGGGIASSTSQSGANSSQVSDNVAAAAPSAAKAPATAAKPARPAAAPAPAKAPAAPKPPATKSIKAEVELQPNYFYCGPAATRIALSAHGKKPSFDELAHKLGTTTYGTASAVEVTRVLNDQLGPNRYHTTEISGQTATPKQMDQLQADIVTAINKGDPVVANIAGTMFDTNGELHSYEGGHYLTVVGYADEGRMATIADPADAVGSPSYHLSTIDLANWIATRGYSS
jgi:hypothetical protein